MIPLTPEQIARNEARLRYLIFKATYGWQLKIGALLIHPDKNDPSHRRILNYYWRCRCFLTSARWYVIVYLPTKSHIFSFFHGRFWHGRGAPSKVRDDVA